MVASELKKDDTFMDSKTNKNSISQLFKSMMEIKSMTYFGGI